MKLMTSLFSDPLRRLFTRLHSVTAYLETLDPAEAGVRPLRAPAWQLHVLIFGLALILLVSRRPDFLLHAQFCEEDGRTWYRDAYRLGLKAFIIPCNGCLIVFPRIVAGAVQGLPLIAVPTIYNLAAAACHLFPVSFLFTTRMRDALPCSWARWALAFGIISMPGSSEVLANLSNVHNCHLALLAAMILLTAKPSRFIGWRIFDVLVVLVSGLSGPFCVALLPLGLIRWAFYTRTEASGEDGTADRRWLLLLCGLTAVCAVVQSAVLFHFAAVISAHEVRAGYPNASTMIRHRAPTGASVPLFVDLVGGKIMFASLMGDTRWWKISNDFDGIAKSSVLACLFGAFGAVVVFRSLRFALMSSLRVPLFIAYAGCIFCSALAFPIGNNLSAWTVWLYQEEAANRYWFIPIIGFYMALIVVAAFDSKVLYRRIAILLLLLASIGIVGEWIFTPWPDRGFDRAANDFDKGASGISVRIPERDISSDFVITKR